MKIFIRSAAAALALSLVGVSGAEAQITTVAPGSLEAYYAGTIYANGPATPYATTGVECDDTPYPTEASECAGSFFGNDQGASPPANSEVEAFVASTWGGTGSFLGDVTGSYTGLTGTFVLSLKSSNYFSLYYFDGVSGVTSLPTGGVSDGQGLSHVSLYEVERRSVPEPGTMLLLGTGLLGMAFARRREDEIEA